MPIRMKVFGATCGPVVVCDHCRKQIVDSKDGNYYWRHEEGKTLYEGNVFFLHKRCSHIFEIENPGNWCATELMLFTFYLSNNLKIDKDSQSKLARLMSQIV